MNASTPKSIRAVDLPRLVRLLGYCVLVRWLDSAARPGWCDVDQSGCAHIVSVGIVVRYDPQSIVLAMGISSSGRCHEQITIPLCSITAINKLSKNKIHP